MRCLSCEIHVVYRIVLRFTREAVIAQRHLPVLDRFVNEFKPNVFYSLETPQLLLRSMKGGVATILLDMKMPNQQKRALVAFGKNLAKMINSNDLDEGFIEIHEASDIIELIEWEEYKPVCKQKPKKFKAQGEEK